MAGIEDRFRRWQDCPAGDRKNRRGKRLMEEIWHRYHPRLQVFLGGVPEGEREDRASEILLRVFESLDRYNPQFAFSTWLYHIARNSEVDHFRRKEPVLVEWDEGIHSPAEDGDSPEAILLREEEKALLAGAVESLKPADRELLFLACYEGMPYGEISRILGRPVGTIKYEMHRIRGLLKARLEKEFCYEAE